MLMKLLIHARNRDMIQLVYVNEKTQVCIFGNSVTQSKGFMTWIKLAQCNSEWGNYCKVKQKIELSFMQNDIMVLFVISWSISLEDSGNVVRNIIH